MRSLRLFLFCVVAVLASMGVVEARIVRHWPIKELWEKAELVVMATPTATGDAKEHGGMPGFHGQPVVGVETTFAVVTVLKGAVATKTIVLYHYRADKIEAINAPTFLSFDPKKKQVFRLFLVRGGDGRYAPVAGQTDPDISIQMEDAK